MPFAYYARLSTAHKRIYRRSDAVETVELPDAASLRPLVDELAEALGDEDRHATERACQRLADAMLRQLALPPVRLSVLAARPSHDWGELHGYYDPTREDVPPTITLWMRTAQRKQVVAFRTFLRTFLHELGHHLDYELLKLAETFHTEGFYKRESSLFRQLVMEEESAPPSTPSVARPDEQARLELASRPARTAGRATRRTEPATASPERSSSPRGRSGSRR